jgi:CHAT domain-containing protein
MPDDPRFVVSFAATLLEAFQAGGTAEDLTEALRLLHHARELCPVGSADYRAVQTNLGNAIRASFARDGDLDDLDHALECHRAAVDGLCDSAPDAAIYLTMYGHALRERYAQAGDLRDLEASGLAYARASAAALGSEQDAVQAAKGTASLDVYRRTGNPAELRAAIGFFSQAAQLCPPACPALPAYLSDLGTAYRLRYLHTGQLRDLERALASLDDAITRTSAASRDLDALLATRGMLWLDSFNRTGSLGTVDAAVADLVEAVGAAPSRAPRRADYQAALAAALMLRHELAAATSDIQADEGDVDNAVALLESALTLISAQAVARPTYVGMLGNARLVRYRRDEHESDLDGAIELLEQARRSAGVTERAGLAEKLAEACRLRWGVRHRDDDLRRAIDMYDEACRPGLVQGPGQMAEVAQEWGRWALERESWPEAARAYRRCLENITLLSASHAARHHKDAWLEPAAEVPSRVAYAYARAGDPDTAAALFERGRGFLLNQTAEWRRTLQAGHPALHARLRDALSAADAMAAAAQGTWPGSTAAYLPVTQFEREYQELDQVLAEVAAVTDGNAGRLDLAGARLERLEDTWLVQLAPGPRSGVALISPPEDDTVAAIPLARASETALGEQLSILRSAYGQRRTVPLTWQAALDEVTGWLGRNICQPLMGALPQDADVVLIGGGALGLLPLHAAWIPHSSGPEGRHYLLDHVRVRHAPNIASVQQGSRAAGTARTDKLLLIDDPRWETTPIRAARLSRDFLSHYFHECVSVSGAHATRSAVLRALTETGCGVVHLSCHGEANATRPMESAFLLAGGDTLTVRDLFGAPAPPLRLGVLAGCETGVAGSNLPDEVLGLPTALIAAGVIGVVASAWAIPDQVVTAVLLARFYELWRAGLNPPAEALRQAQRWIRDSTNHQKVTLYPWYGEAYPGRTGGAAHRMWLSARAHDHPYWWAGFTYTGA